MKERLTREQTATLKATLRARLATLRDIKERIKSSGEQRGDVAAE